MLSHDLASRQESAAWCILRPWLWNDFASLLGQLSAQIRHERRFVQYFVYHLADIRKTSTPLGVLFCAMTPAALFFRHNAFKNSGLSMLANVWLNVLHRVSKTVTDNIFHFSSGTSCHTKIFSTIHLKNSDYVIFLSNISLFCTTDNVIIQQ